MNKEKWLWRDYDRVTHSVMRNVEEETRWVQRLTYITACGRTIYPDQISPDRRARGTATCMRCATYQ